MILIDSNVLVYALNTRSPYQGRAREFITFHQYESSLAHQNIIETYRVITHQTWKQPVSPTKAHQLLQSFTSTLPIIHPIMSTLEIFTRLTKKYHLNGSQTFDAYLAATALSHGITTIATHNTKDFTQFDEIELVDPFASDAST